MKRIFLLASLCTSFLSYSQYDSRFGLTAGVTDYYVDANFLSSKSEAGYFLGMVSTVPISENSEVVVEVTLNRFNMQLLGRENMEAGSEWLKFHTDRINVVALYDYDILHFLDEDLAIGVNAGATLGLLNNMVPTDTNKEDYLLDPYGIEAHYLETEGIVLNAYANFGITARYRNLEAHLRYNLGLTSPYRNLAVQSQYITFEGKDDYLSFSLVYYFGNNF